MKLKIAALLALAALSVVAAGTARADVPAVQPGDAWCGESSDAACQSSMLYVECADGTIWLADPAYTDADTIGQVVCAGDYTSLQPAPPATDDSAGDSTDDSTDTQAAPPEDQSFSLGGGTDVGMDASSTMAPDPTQYATEVQCPDGTMWAVAFGDDTFVCPAA